MNTITPDFYNYDWQPISSCHVAACGKVHLRWADGVALECHPWWLRENSAGPDGIDPVTRENDLDPALLDPSTHVATAEVDSDGGLTVLFQPEGRVAQYHPGWLRHVADGQHGPHAGLPPVEVWTTADRQEPATHDGVAVLNNDEALAAWLNDLVRFGLARLVGIGTDPETVGTLATRVGAMRGSNFGLMWHVDVDLDPVSTANTAQRLAAHTDLPTRETPPGYQFLHCLVNTAAGGESTMCDGLAVAEHLAANEPEVFEALRTLKWVFFNRAKDHDHRWIGPIIDDGDSRVPLTFRAFHPVRAFPSMPHEDIGRAYAAIRRFGALSNSAQFQMKYAFAPGDLIAFDNRRVLHGRDSFDVGPAAQRRLHGTYMDTDEVYSRLRVLNRRAATV